MSATVTRQPRDQRPDGPQLYASGRRVATRATDADGCRTDSFAVYDVDHDATTNLPDLPGLIRLEGHDGSELVLVQVLRVWVETHRAKLQAAAPRGLRHVGHGRKRIEVVADCKWLDFGSGSNPPRSWLEPAIFSRGRRVHHR
jgi:hypothetical protein